MITLFKFKGYKGLTFVLSLISTIAICFLFYQNSILKTEIRKNSSRVKELEMLFSKIVSTNNELGKTHTILSVGNIYNQLDSLIRRVDSLNIDLTNEKKRNAIYISLDSLNNSKIDAINQRIVALEKRQLNKKLKPSRKKATK